LDSFFSGREVKSTFLDRITPWISHRWLLPFYPLATESIDLRNYNVVISSTSSFMKGIVVKPRTLHISYCHSPTRYLWDYNREYLEESFSFWPSRMIVSSLLNYLRMWDRMAAERVDFFIANSNFTKDRIKKYYNRDSEVVYPPVDVKNFKVSKKNKGYFLVVSRLSPYKKVDLVVEAFNRLGWPLVIVGEGKDRKRLEKMANRNVRFLGFVSEKRLRKIYSYSRAFIFPALDDFGMTMVESMASGKPVIAFRGGGALEIIEEGITGEFFSSQQPEIFIDTLRRFAKKEYSPEYIKSSVEKFSRENFEASFKKVLENAQEMNQMNLFTSNRLNRVK